MASRIATAGSMSSLCPTAMVSIVSGPALPSLQPDRIWICRAPSVDRDARVPIRGDRLGPGRSAAPGEQRLTLLPSGPDVVHEPPLRGTRSSTPLAPSASANAGLERGFSPAEAVCRFRAPLVPRLARPRDDTPRPAAG